MQPMYGLLIVDDEPIVRKGILNLIDFDVLNISQVLEATNGVEAYDLFQKHHPHIILADINMPQMNGLEFAAKVKEESPSTRIALITGYDYFDYAVTALKTGVDDYILKPVSRQDIIDLLHKLLGKITEEKINEETRHVVEDIKKTTPATDDQGYKSQLYQFIEENIGNKDLSLSYVAEHMGLSTGYLSGLFKKLFHVSFKSYVMTRRMERAKLLLLTTEMKNYEIAESIGFDDPNYFSACFKRQFGLPPGKYKDKVKE